MSGASLFLGSVRPSLTVPPRLELTFVLVSQVPSAIFLFASLTGIAHDRVRIVPVINTSSTVTIAAELEDGQIIAGQSEISHPSATTSAALEHGVTTPAVGSYLGGAGAGPGGLKPESYFPLTRATTPSFPEPPVLGAEEDDSHSELPFAPSPDPNSLSAFTSASSTPAPTLLAPSSAAAAAAAPTSRNLEFTKDSHAIAPLPARIKRIFYLNAYGSEIWPRPNTVFLNALRDATCLVYAPGSLYTSIVPCVALRPVGELIARGAGGALRFKVLLLNATEDRETPAYRAGDFVRALTDACARSFDGGEARGDGQGRCEPRDVVTHVVWVRNGQVEVDERELVVRLSLSLYSRAGLGCTPLTDPASYAARRLSGSSPLRSGRPTTACSATTSSEKRSGASSRPLSPARSETDTVQCKETLVMAPRERLDELATSEKRRPSRVAERRERERRRKGRAATAFTRAARLCPTRCSDTSAATQQPQQPAPTGPAAVAAPAPPLILIISVRTFNPSSSTSRTLERTPDLPQVA